MSQRSETGMSLSGKRVVVIGGATGIGFAIAKLASAQGATVVVGSRSPAKVDEAVTKLSQARGHVVDLEDEASVEGFFRSVGAFDHLAVTAGNWDIPMFGSIHDLDLVQAPKLLSVRFWGLLTAAKVGCRTIASDGSITFTSGVLAHRPPRGAVMATALGGAVESLTRGLAMDLAPVRVNAVCPGLILTEVVNQRPQASLQAMVAHLPLPRVGTPHEVALAYVYLMLNGYATGQVLPVEGGGLLV